MERLAGTGAGKLPVPLTRCFGRNIEVDEVVSLLAEARLVTLVGAPGCGKSRLSIEVGALMSSRFPDAVWFVELAPLSDPALIARTVGMALGVAEQPGRTVLDAISATVGTREALLVLDNCEHVADAAASLALGLLSACPSFRILATSRVALGIPGEQIHDTRPLDPESAVALFADRARLASSGFRVDDTTGSALVIDICGHLDGLPLALELAAAWTRVLSLHQIADNVTRDVPLPPRGTSDTTMAEMVDRSLRLLPPDTQGLFDWLSVFAGGFDLAAAESVAAGYGDVLAGLTSLVDHSLVMTERTTSDLMRYRLLEPIRQYGAARLAELGERDDIRRRHAEHYLDVAQACDIQLRHGDRPQAFRRLEQEEGNFLAALDWARAHPSEFGLRLCTALAHFWELRGWVNDGRTWLQTWLETMLQVETADDTLRATALARAGRLAWRQRDYARARVLLEESLEIARELDDPLAAARRLRSLALVATAEGDTEAAIRLCDQSIALFRRHGDGYGLVWALIFAGWAQYVHGDIDAGDANMHDALAASGPGGNRAAVSNALIGLATGADFTRDVPAQRAYLEQALGALREASGVGGDPDWIWGGMALAVNEGRYRSALRLAGGAEALSRRSGNYINQQFMARVRAQLERARAQVGTAAAPRMEDQGARLTPDELMTEALANADYDAAQPLTRREQEIAELVGEGLTNVEIAEKLVISRRTVESHVEHIKQKLEFGTRNQIIVWMLQHADSGDHPNP
jgi:predicted ATPase/DNA-binding CsgD family transcriptional regulator